MIIGNPTMPSVGDPPEPLKPLPFAEQEAIAIASILKTTPILGKQATEEAITRQMSNARLIHFATHGLLDDLGGVGVPGALALAPTQTSDGLLSTNEILNLSLQAAELVVLSACDTGRGQITGDGVIGLSRSFISAGAPSVVVSLWSVPDDATAVLMTEFYQNLQQTNKAQALRQAMLTTMKQYPNSRDWAAFTLVGESE
ncbi:MAG: CHAT domain-containing protein [Oscillatoriales cyanobacterium C42_A2020_001]|nr:CHAT domain-containing protein [Leptolyngbyaceae cyanobacterium C42_A2020_001]